MSLLISISIMYYSMIHGIHPELVESIVTVESRGNPNATGSLGEIGLMQIRKEYWKGPMNLYEPELNIAIGTKKLKKLKKYSKQLGSYYFVSWNLGPTGALRYNKNRPIKKFTYAKKVDKVFNSRVILAEMRF